MEVVFSVQLSHLKPTLLLLAFMSVTRQRCHRVHQAEGMEMVANNT